MTATERNAAIAHVLAECGDNLDNMNVVNTVMALRLSHVYLGPDLWAAVDEARAQRMEVGR